MRVTPAALEMSEVEKGPIRNERSVGTPKKERQGAYRDSGPWLPLVVDEWFTSSLNRLGRPLSEFMKSNEQVDPDREPMIPLVLK